MAAKKAAELEHAVMERRKRALAAQSKQGDKEADTDVSEAEESKLDALVQRIRTAAKAKGGAGAIDAAELARLQKEARAALDSLMRSGASGKGPSSSSPAISNGNSSGSSKQSAAASADSDSLAMHDDA